MMKLLISYLALTFVAILPALAFQSAAEKSKDMSKVEVRFLAERIPRNLGKVVLVSEDLRSDPFDLPMNNLSPPQKPPARIFSVFAVDENVSIAAVKLPEEGNSFVVILLPSTKDRGVYSPLVIPFENPNFKGGDIYFHNNSNKPVLGLIGKTKMALAPGKGTVITPRGFGDEKYYHVMLGVREAKGNKVIKSMKWPSSKTMRNYVFFYVDPRKNRVSYRAVDEFILPKQ
jgi:hypothetical protein